MTRDEIAEIKRKSEEQASWGFISRYGRTGRITSLQNRSEGQTLEPDIRDRYPRRFANR